MDAESKLAVVKELRQTESKNDIIMDGKVLSFHGQPCRGGIHLEYQRRGKAVDILGDGWGGFSSIGLAADQLVVMTVCQCHVAYPKWWQVILGISMERKVRWHLKRMKAALDRQNKMKKIIDSLGV